MLVKGDQGHTHPDMIEQTHAVAGIFSGDQIRLCQGIHGTSGEVIKVTNRCGNHVQCALAKTIHVITLHWFGRVIAFGFACVMTKNITGSTGAAWYAVQFADATLWRHHGDRQEKEMPRHANIIYQTGRRGHGGTYTGRLCRHVGHC
ncbi:hypothetical protein GCM10010082_28510 [Kushneria pakistanensis]|uniref:KOW domain-containing protein n=1 Tax=Kushneria pakistanensis TaxID=1508770 RepID=A0ABQ3FPB5_9GAMM|nr:hypothetical protein GCM10010082_28510 [Kushneria pakistanensis]